MTAAIRNALRFIPETLNELRIDVQEIVEFVCEQFGLDDVWTRCFTLFERILRRNTQKPSPQISGRSRSLIRRIGSRLNLKPPKRYNFRVVDVAQMDDEPVRAGLFNLTNEFMTSNARIKHRWSMPKDILPCLENDADDTTFITVLNCSPSQSTPKRTAINRRATFEISTDSDKLRAELERLRSEIAAIVAIKETDESPPPSHRGRSGPPPPPPLPSQPLFAPRSGLSANKAIRVLPIGRLELNRSSPASSSFRMDMTEILKDIANVKLRKVDRSPGGTPLRNKDRLVSEPNDPAAIIAAALKRRFSHLETLQESLEKEQQDSSAWDSSDSVESPFTSPVVSPKIKPAILQHPAIEFAY